MASESTLVSIGIYKASADLSTKQYLFAKVSGDGTVTVAAANADSCIGIIQNKPVSGEGVDVGVAGISKCIAGAAVTAGAKLMSDASGRAITLATSASVQAGIALTTCSNAAEYIDVLLTPVGHVLP